MAAVWCWITILAGLGMAADWCWITILGGMGMAADWHWIAILGGTPQPRARSWKKNHRVVAHSHFFNQEL